MIEGFASLHNHSHFSVFDGLSLPEEMVKQAKEKGLRSIALTDHGVSHGHADFYLAGKKEGVKTVFGVEAYVLHDLEEWRREKEEIEAEKKATKSAEESEVGEGLIEALNVGKKRLKRKGHLVLLACNRTGLSNLYRLIYRSHKEGFYGKPRMDKRMLREHSEGLIASTACMGGIIALKAWDLKNGLCGWDDVVREAREFDDIFGRGRFFLELQFNEHDSQRYINEVMVKVSRETGIPLTATTDSHYATQEQWEAREIMHMLAMKKTAANAVDTEIKQLYIKSPHEMWETFESFPGGVEPKVAIEAFQNTLLMDELVEDYEPDTHQRLPTLPYENPFKEMGQRAIAGLRSLGLADHEEYQKQLLHELQIIKDKGIANYFLIVQEIVKEAKKEMLVGAGRGSAAGSLVCYCLGITDLDPIEHNLMFERFLDPSRIELPDIDIDFQDVDGVKDMLRKMFGEDNVACLSTYGTFQIKGLLKDLSRVYGLDHNEVNKVNKKIESELRVLYKGQDKSTIVIRLEDIERVSPTFNNFVEEHPDVGKHLRTLYNRNRQVGRHAAGVIIGDNLPSETSVFTSKEGIVQASFTEGIVNKNISAMGFVKFDILSLATLKVVDHALRLVAQRTGKTYEEMREAIRPCNMDLNDQHVLETIFWKGNFAGIFQFTEKGIRRLGQRIRPDSFVDVSAICSLYRPGPLGSRMDKLYGDNKRDRDNISYDHPLLEEILGPTNGCLVFQEQLMQVANKLGKMSFKDVQRIRKVLLKKDKSKSAEFLKKENDELKGKFVVGCKENDLTEEKAEEWWKNLLYFGGYGFNKAHSDAYSVLTMQTAWLSTYHPLEFYSALLTHGKSGDMQGYVGDIKKRGIRVLPVDANNSKNAHVIEGDAIRLSFSSVLGVGPSAIDKIVANQPYESFLDFLDRSKVGKTAVSPLVMVGAFDSLFPESETCAGPNMKALEEFYDACCADPKLKQKKRRAELESLFWEKTSGTGLMNPINDYAPHEKIGFENALLGFSLLGSPFEVLDRDKKIEALRGTLDDMLSYDEFVESELECARIPVALTEWKERPQRNGQMFAFMKFAAESGEEFEAPCFGNIWKWIAPHARKNAVYVTTFNRKSDDPRSLVVGRPGWAHSQHSALQAVINVDDIEL